MESSDQSTGQTQYLTFHLAGEEYAVGILQVKEIITYGTLTRVPQTPPSIRGVLNLRGNVVPVVDLALKFGLVPNPVTDRSCIVIVETQIDGESVVMGVIADSVSQVIEMDASDILPVPAFGTAIRVEYLRGMGKSDKKFFLILDIDKVLTSDELRTSARAPEPANETARILERTQSQTTASLAPAKPQPPSSALASTSR